MKPATARKLLLRMHWKLMDTSLPPEPKLIFLGAPHSSIWDFVVAWLYVRAFDRKPRVMIKKEFFFWPIGPLIKKMGAIPVDRSNATSLVKSMIEQMEDKDTFILAIAPEGTRKATKKWKTGYHLIAKTANVPVYLGYFDWGRKRVSAGEKVELTDDARADTDRIQAIYESMHLQGKNPEGFITH